MKNRSCHCVPLRYRYVTVTITVNIAPPEQSIDKACHLIETKLCVLHHHKHILFEGE